MELLYIWIKEWGPFKDANINFGGKYIFSYDSDSHKLECTDNPSYIENFFNDFPENKIERHVQIKNVTAIVGENGAGKTMLLDFIKRNLVRFWDEESIIIFMESDGKIIVHNNLGNKNKFQCNNQKVIVKFYSKPKSKEFLGGGMRTKTGYPKLIDETDKTNLIFFSNIADLRPEEEYNKLRNISTNYLLKTDKKLEYEKKICNNIKSEIEVHKERDIERQLNFIVVYKEKKELINFKLPDKISIKPRVDYFDGNNKLISNLIDKIGEASEFCQFVQEFIKQIGSYRNQMSPMEIAKHDKRLNKLKGTLQSNIFLHVIQELCIHYNTPNRIFWDNLRNLKANDLRKPDFKIVILLKRLKRINTKDVNFNNWISGAIDFISYLNKTIDLEGKEEFMIDIMLPHKTIYPLINNYKKSYLVDGNLLFNWRDMSSGEKAFLNIFSRFHSLSDKQTKAANMKLKENLIILIDEGDLYLHPRWQQNLLKNLLDFLTIDYVFENQNTNRKIQIILTTNQPIIASDLPKNNIIFMKQSNNNKCEIVTSSDKKETFGANIHYLLADSFFLNDGYIGEFVKQKINRLIELIVKEDEMPQKDTKKLIKMIGEPIVKKKLLQMIEYKLNDNSQKE